MPSQPDNHIEEDIPVYLTGGLTPDQRRAFESHIAACPQCAAALEEAKTLETQMTAMFAGARPTEGFEDRIIQKFRKRGTRAGRPLIHPMVRKVASAVAAAVVLGGAGVVVTNGLNGAGPLARTVAWLDDSKRGELASDVTQAGRYVDTYRHDFGPNPVPYNDVLRYPTDWPDIKKGNDSSIVAGGRAQ